MTGVQLIVAEKPSLGISIANAIGGPMSKHGGHIRLRNIVVTWCFGHMLELAAPEKYDARWEKWLLETLPIAVPEGKWKLLPRAGAADQIKVIKMLMAEATSVVNAGDPDREGQMLVDEILDHCGWRGKTERLLMYDTTPESIRKALGRMKPNSEFANLYAAAMCRSRADWLVGLNLTRAASKRIGTTASIGRVQTPTLALIVRRDQAIASHKSSGFYTLHAQTSTARETFLLSHEPKTDRITDKAEASRIAAALKEAVVTLRVTEKSVTEHAPLPHMLATFQAEAEARHGWGAQHSLKVLQDLYEKQLVSYPRTSCAYLPEEQASQALPLARMILESGHFPQVVPIAGLLAPSDRTYNDAKVEQHHGLTPKAALPKTGVDADGRKGWEIVAEQFIKSLMPAYQAAVKTLSFTFEDRLFSATGETPANEMKSWRVLEPKLGVDKKPIKPLACSMGDGESADARVGQVTIKEGKTTPPKHYTEATLIADMRSIYKYVTDPRLKAMLKETVGIGTAATQGAIIETLKTRKFVTSVKAGRSKVNHLRATEFGTYLITNIPATLADPGVTAAWEAQLNKIADGEADPADFMERIDGFVIKQLDRIKSHVFPMPPALEKVATSAPKGRATGARSAAAR